MYRSHFSYDSIWKDHPTWHLCRSSSKTHRSSISMVRNDYQCTLFYNYTQVVWSIAWCCWISRCAFWWSGISQTKWFIDSRKFINMICTYIDTKYNVVSTSDQLGSDIWCVRWLDLSLNYCHCRNYIIIQGHSFKQWVKRFQLKQGPCTIKNNLDWLSLTFSIIGQSGLTFSTSASGDNKIS